MSILPFSAAAIEAKFLRHAYSPYCGDCVDQDYPCAAHRGACVSCGHAVDVHPIGFSRSKVDRSGCPLVEQMCGVCDPHTGGDECLCATCDRPTETLRSGGDPTPLVLGEFPDVDSEGF